MVDGGGGVGVVAGGGRQSRALSSDVEVLLGMLAPLAGAVATWVLVARTYARGRSG